jgi:predicted alpha/beta superfamily hydrolase
MPYGRGMGRLWLAVALLGAACSAGATRVDPPVADGGFDAGVADLGLHLDADGLDQGLDAGADDQGTSTDGGPTDDASTDAGVPGCWPGGATELEKYRGLLDCLRAPGTDEQKRVAITTFVAEVQSGGGFPIVTSSQAIFIYVRDPAYDQEDDGLTAEDYDPDRRVGPIRVAGDFNGWATTGLELREEVQAFLHGAFPLDVATSDRWRYKFIAKNPQGDDIWYSDPLSRRHDYDQNGRISIIRGGQGRGHLERIGPLQSAGISARSLEVWLPPGYDLSTDTYPVLYLHDGNNLYSRFQPRSAPTSWEADQVFEAELTAGNIAPFIAVGIPNSSARFDEYTQTTDTRTGSEVGGRAVDYANFLLTQVKPAVDGRLRTRPDRTSTGVLGSSLGGLVSYYLGLHHPEVYGCVAGLSSSFWWGDSLGNPTMIDDYQADPDLPTQAQRYYLDSGGGPGAGCPDSGADNYCSTIAMRDLLVARGIDTFPDDPDVVPLTPAEVDIFHWWTPDAPHNESAWHERLARPLRLCFPAP